MHKTQLKHSYFVGNAHNKALIETTEKHKIFDNFHKTWTIKDHNFSLRDIFP